MRLSLELSFPSFILSAFSNPFLQRVKPRQVSSSTQLWEDHTELGPTQGYGMAISQLNTETRGKAEQWDIMQRRAGQRSWFYTPRAGAPNHHDSPWAGRAVNGKPKSFQEFESGKGFSRKRLSHWAIWYTEQKGEQSLKPFLKDIPGFPSPLPFLFFLSPLSLRLRVFLSFRSFPSSTPGLSWFLGDFSLHRPLWGGHLSFFLSKMGFVLSLNNIPHQILKPFPMQQDWLTKMFQEKRGKIMNKIFCFCLTSSWESKALGEIQGKTLLNEIPAIHRLISSTKGESVNHPDLYCLLCITPATRDLLWEMEQD